MDVWLSRFSIFGVFVFLCAQWALWSNTYYHKLIILFLWIPALLHGCVFYRRYRVVDGVFISLYLVLSAWYAFVVVQHAGMGDGVREVKLPLYIGLSFLGFLVAALYLKERFSDLLLVCGLLGGVGAGFSWFYFDVLQEHGFRLVAVGLWNKVIPAAQASGALMILAVFLGLRRGQKPWVLVCLALALSGYVVFLWFNQTRWVWFSLIASLLGVALLSKSRVAWLAVAASLAALVVVLLIEPRVLWGRGASYRPELWLGGVDLLLQNWVLGLGFQDFWIYVAAKDTSFSHPHNMLLDIGIRFGLLGLLLWSALWGWVGWKAFKYRASPLGEAAMGLWLYSGIVLLTDGIAPWEKPTPIWFVTWIPMAIVLAMDALASQEKHA